MRENLPVQQTVCFVHGDFHYANLLWEDGKITAVLDYELSGYGIREFDLAWAVFLRPGQKFLKTIDEIKLFLKGYSRRQTFSREAFAYYYVLIACHFYALGGESYRQNVRGLTQSVIEYRKGI